MSEGKLKGERWKDFKGDGAQQRVDGEPVGFARSETEGYDGGCPLGDRGTKSKGERRKLTGLVVEWWQFLRVLGALCGEIGCCI